MFVFRKIWRALFSSNTRFEIRPFALLSTNLDLQHINDINHELHRFNTFHQEGTRLFIRITSLWA